MYVSLQNIFYLYIIYPAPNWHVPMLHINSFICFVTFYSSYREWPLSASGG